MTSPSDVLLPRLDRVRETGPGRWLARCPAHDDRTPSLSVRETSDGTLLLHCWAGCPAVEVVAATNLKLRDLFPRPLTGRGPLLRGERWVPADVLNAVAGEATLVALAAGDIVASRSLIAEDRDRVQIAAGRLRAAAEEVSHG